MATEPVWLTEARKYIGQREIVGRKHNPLILRWWALIRAPFTDDETPWCAGFVGGILESVKIRSSRSAAARSYLNWGEKLNTPIVGAICVLERGPKFGHVFFITGRDKAGNIVGVGGNQANMVSEKAFPISRVLGYRWPAGVEKPVIASLPIINVNGPLSSNEA